MSPVFQTRFGDNGNCEIACIASIIHVDITLVDASANLPDDSSGLTDLQFAELVCHRTLELDAKLNYLGWGIIQIGYDAFTQRMTTLNAMPKCSNVLTLNKTDIERVKRHTKNDVNRPLIDLPYESHCILSMKIQNERIGHSVVGYIDGDGNINVKHDPTPPELREIVEWNMGWCKTISFLIKK